MQIRKMSPQPPVEWSSEMNEIEIPTSLFRRENFNRLLRRCALAVVHSEFQTDGNDAMLLCVAVLFCGGAPPPPPILPLASQNSLKGYRDCCCEQRDWQLCFLLSHFLSD